MTETKDSKQDDCLLGKRAFLLQLERELERIKRYGHRAAFMLIRPLYKNLNVTGTNYKQHLYDLIKNGLRACDSLYFFDEKTFSAILPDTHEGGGESAALRLKRRIAQAAVPGAPTASIIGLVSIGPENIKDVQAILNDLKRDMKRDEVCQIVLPTAKTRAIGKVGVLIWCRDRSVVRWIKDALSYRLDVGTACDIDEVKSFLQGGMSYVLVFGPDIGAEECSEVLRKIQSLSKPEAVFKISSKRMEGGVAGDIDVVISEDLHPRLLTTCILSSTGHRINDRDNDVQKYINALSAISSATHQLNQPLQIIIGKLELLILDIEESEVKKSKIKDTLAQIRKQALYSADINQKINRLTKF